MQEVSSVPVTKGKFCASLEHPCLEVIDKQSRLCGVFGALAVLSWSSCEWLLYFGGCKGDAEPLDNLNLYLLNRFAVSYTAQRGTSSSRCICSNHTGIAFSCLLAK